MADKYKWKDERTGQEYIGDEFGNRTESSPTDREYILPSKPFENKDVIRPLNAADEFYNLIGRRIAPGLTMAGGVAGGIAGTPLIGGAAGAGAGSAIGKLLQSSAPQFFGEYRPSSPAQMVENIGTDVLIDLLGTGIGKTAGKLTPSNLKKSFEESIAKIFKPDPDVPASVFNQQPLPKEFPNPDLTTGQTSRFGRFFEDVFSPTEKEAKIARQQAEFGDWFKRQQLDPEVLMQTGQANAIAEKEMMQSTRQQLYDDFKPFIAKNTKRVEVVLPVKNKGTYGWGTAQPVSRMVDIEGAIPLKQSKTFAETLGEQIQKELGPNDINEANMGAGVGGDLKRILTELNKIRGVRTAIDPKQGIHTDDPLMSFYQLKTLKDDINRFLTKSKADPVMLDRLRGSLRAFASSINTDIKAGVKGWGTQASKTYEKAQNYHANMVKRLQPGIVKKTLRAEIEDPDITYMRAGQEALSDPQKMRHFINITNDKRATAKQLLLNDLSDSTIDATTGTFSPGKALEYLEKNKLVAKEVLTPQYRTNVKRFLQKANQVQPLGWQSFANSLNMTKGRAAISAGLGLGNLALTGDTKSSAAFSGLLFFSPMAAKEFSKRILMDPYYTKIATGALRASPNSPAGKQAARILMGAAKGLQVDLMTHSGRKVPTTVNEKGEIVIPE